MWRLAAAASTARWASAQPTTPAVSTGHGCCCWHSRLLEPYTHQHPTLHPTAARCCHAAAAAALDACYGVSCGTHGNCSTTTGACVCEAGWGGAECGYNFSAEPCYGKDCNFHGTCNQATGQCVCDPSWQGANCDVQSRLASVLAGASLRASTCLTQAHTRHRHICRLQLAPVKMSTATTASASPTPTICRCVSATTAGAAPCASQQASLAGATWTPSRRRLWRLSWWSTMTSRSSCTRPAALSTAVCTALVWATARACATQGTLAVAARLQTPA